MLVPACASASTVQRTRPVPCDAGHRSVSAGSAASPTTANPISASANHTPPWYEEGMRAALILCALFASACAESSVVGRAPLTNGRSAEIVTIPLRLSNVHLIRARIPVLVDTGTVGDMDDLAAALEARGVATSGIGLVILTHGHADHAGLAADIQRIGRATVILGAGDVPLAVVGHNDDLKPTGFAGSVLKPFIRSIYTPFTPDIAVSEGDTVDLSPWGIDGKVVAMPGHTPGSIVVLLSDHTAFIGDMIAGGSLGGAFFPHSPGEHLYQADPVQNRHNIKRLLDLGVQTFYLGHGGPVSRADVIKAFP
jgi:hydroxyacylglutathione hydrolase